MNRYDRHILLDLIGEKGQEKINKAHIAIIGCGGLGAIAATYLAGAGTGTLTLIDGDIPDITNLHRQVFFDPQSKEKKSIQLKNYIRKFNPEIKINAFSDFITKSNINRHLTSADIVLECTDEIYTKYLVNDFCHIHHKPMVYASLHKYDGYLSTFLNRNNEDIHLRDIFSEPDLNVPNCSEVGVLNTIAGMMGILQANEAIKVICNINEVVNSQLLIYNAVTNEQTKLNLKKSWKGDINRTWNDNSYKMAYNCDIPEIEVQELFKDSNNYKIISILNGKNHEPITEDTEHIQAADFNIYDWEPEEDRPTVIYCTSGKVSLQLALQLKEEHPDHTILSLKGGIKAVRKYRQQSTDVH
jgi:molybdopterin/thiamine biosynthesis adenylyltransferase/rhodanese-related sulfurtransferase